MVAARPYHQVQISAAGGPRCFACGASSWPRGESCPGARPLRERATSAEVLLAECRAVLGPALDNLNTVEQECDSMFLSDTVRALTKLLAALDAAQVQERT